VNRISVVIGTRNQRSTLERVLVTFAAQTVAASSFEVVVVDSESTDGTDRVCTATAWPFPLRYFRRANTGKAGARNQAIREAASNLVFLTDGDVLADPDLLASHVASQRRFPGAASVGRQVIIDTFEQMQRSGRDALSGVKREGQRLRWNQLVTGNVSVPRQLLIDAGLFDEDFVGYGYEDYELGYRLVRRGVPIVYQPSAVNYHWHPVRFEEDLPRKREAGHAAVLFCRKHPSRHLRWKLGVHPVNRAMWLAAAGNGWLVRGCRRWASLGSPRGRAARAFLLEREFQQGIREAWEAR
jgi:GT2 family glycosyltransferase